MRSAASLLIAALAVAGCSGPAQSPAASAGVSAEINAADFKPDLSMQELMAHVIDYNADGVWLNQGWVQSADGIEELFPTTPEGWLATENAALTLAETANVLMLPGRVPDGERAWIDYSRGMYDAAINAARAAEKASQTGSVEDKQAFFDAGGELYVVCRSCHQRYVIGEIR